MSWKKIKLEEVLTQSKNKIEIVDSETYSLVTISKTGLIKKRNEVLGINIKGKTAYVIKNNDFIYSRLAVHNGAFGLIPNNLNGAIVTNEMPSFIIDKNILSEFLIYSLKLPEFQFQLKQLTKGVGRTRVKEKDFLKLTINITSLENQRNIISNLKIINSDVSNNSIQLTHQLDLVKKLRQAFLREAMQGKLVEQNPNDEPAIKLLAKIKAEKEQLIKEKKIKKPKPLPPITKEEIPFEIPENWVWCRLGKVVEMGRGRFSIRPRNDPRYFNGSYPFLQIGSLNEYGSRIYNAPQTLNEKGLAVSKMFPKNTIVIAIVGGTIGNLGVLGVEMCFTDSMIGFFPYPSMYNQEYILNFLRFKQPEIKYASYQMAGQPNIKIPTLSELYFPLPPLSEQKRIVAKLDVLMTYCDSLEESIKNSQSQNEMLLQQVLREALEPKENLTLSKQD